MLRVLDLFSGIGGFSLGLERTGGFETVAFCEINKSCRHLLAHHWPDTITYDDVTSLTGQRLVADGIVADVLCGGFPCQDVSYAGKGAGLDGARSGLWFEIARLLRELRDLGRPVRFVILENVSALLGRGLGTVLGDLAALGYDAEWDCIPASAVGAPHRRDRIWIVAHPRGEQHEGFGDAFRRALASELPSAALGDDADCEQQGSVGSLRSGPNSEPGRDGDVADAARQLRNGSGSGSEQDGRPEPANGGDVGDPHGERLPVTRITGGASQAASSVKAWRAPDRTGWWSTEPDVGRVAHGVPARVDRLHGLGNAVVPQIPEMIGRAILAADQDARQEAA